MTRQEMIQHFDGSAGDGMPKMRGFYRYEPFGRFGDIEHMIFSIYKDDGRFGSSFSVPCSEVKNNIVALAQMGYRALPNGWSSHDIRAALAA